MSAAASSCPKCGARLAAVDGLCAACVARSITTLLSSGNQAASAEDEPEIPGYELHEIIGHGGMGTVFRATRISDGSAAAVKLMHPHLAARPDFAQRLEREAAALMALDHPHVLRIIEHGTAADGRWFLATELAGGDLGQLMQKGPLPAAEALRLFRQAATAIAAAHRHGITHRDIKPANILIGGDGSAQVADFSLAKILREGGAPAFTLTQSTEVFGTPYYIAPEVRRGAADADHRADIFSLGVLLHEMLSGRLPIGAYEPASKTSGIPAAVDRLIARCLQEDPAKRPQSVDLLLRELEAACAERAWKKWLQAAAAIALLCGIAVAVMRRHEALAHPGSPALSRAGKSAVQAMTFASIPAQATREQPWQNSLGMRFIPVPGMRPLFSVWETRSSDFAAWPAMSKATASSLGGAHPATPVSFLDAAEFCAWLSQQEIRAGLLPPGAQYRLPTDEEWSQAAGLPAERGTTPEERQANRIGNRRLAPFPWGKGWPPPGDHFPANFAGQESALNQPVLPDGQMLRHRDAWPTTAPAGSFAPNALGLCDLSGNAAEWCATPWSGDGSVRTLRGGSWNQHLPDDLRLDTRHPAPAASSGIEGSGFRIVIELPMLGGR